MFGVIYIYPYPYDPNPRACAIAMPMAQYCPGENYYIHNGVPISGTINPETGKCEVKPGGVAKNATCPEGTTSFRQGYCIVRHVPTCPKGFQYDRQQGNCDNPDTGVMNEPAVFKSANDFECPQS